MERFAIDFGNERTTVAVEPIGVFGKGVQSLGLKPPISEVVVISDETVSGLYGGKILQSLSDAGFRSSSLVFPPGEKSKSLRVVERLYDELASRRFDRAGLVVALGGGVVSDVAGFVAATWKRGVRFAICATTLEAAIDASIGGKTGVNLPSGKNLVGVFHQPVHVGIDPHCLHSLDMRDIRAGLAESVKHALITSEEFFNWHEANVQAVMELQEGAIEELIIRNMKIKAEIVSRDARERTGERIILNLGHTIGHAIENLCSYELRHGECVALGLIAACRLSNKMDILDGRVTDRVVQILQLIGLPTKLELRIDADQIVEVIRQDKKAVGGASQFVLLEGIGNLVIRQDVTDAAIRDAFCSLC